MILATKLNDKEFYINPHLIESLEETPDTRIHFFTGKVVIVKDTVQEIIDRIIEYRKKLGINSQES